MPVRRQWQKGSIRKKNGKWTLRYREYVYDSEGKIVPQQRTRILLPASRTKSEARRVADQWLAQFQAGGEYHRSALTLQEFWDQYYVPDFLPHKAENTQDLYKCLSKKHLLPAFGDRMLAEITRLEIQRFIHLKEREDYSPQTVRHLRNLLSSIFKKARLMGYVASENPVQGVEVPPMVRVRPHRSVTMEEIFKLTGEFKEPAKSIFLVALSTALRINEILALQLPDTDLENGEFHVLKNLRKKQPGRLKTEGSERKQPIPAPLVEHLKQWLKIRPQGSDWLFPSRNGTPLSNRNLLRRHLHKACDKLGIPRIGWHDARHTFTSLGGEDRRIALTTLQALLGHSSPNTTLLYLHSMDQAKREASNIIAQKLWPFVAQNAQNEQRTGA